MAIGIGLEKKKTQRLESSAKAPPAAIPGADNLLPDRSQASSVITVTALSRNNVAFQIVFRLGRWIYKLNW